jgi:hypothetical protein
MAFHRVSTTLLALTIVLTALNLPLGVATAQSADESPTPDVSPGAAFGAAATADRVYHHGQLQHEQLRDAYDTTTNASAYLMRTTTALYQRADTTRDAVERLDRSRFASEGAFLTQAATLVVHEKRLLSDATLLASFNEQSRALPEDERLTLRRFLSDAQTIVPETREQATVALIGPVEEPELVGTVTDPCVNPDVECPGPDPNPGPQPTPDEPPAPPTPPTPTVGAR